MYLCVNTNRIFDILSIRRHSYFLFPAWSAAAWPPVNCACVSQLFQQLINTTLCPAFLRKFVCQRLCCVPLQIQTFYQNLVLVAEYHVDCRQTLSDVCCDEFLVPHTDCKSKQVLAAMLRWFTAEGAIRIAVRQLSQTWKLRHYDVIDDVITRKL